MSGQGGAAAVAGGRPKVVVTAELPSQGMKRLRERFEVVEAYAGRADLLRKLEGAEGLVCLLSDAVDAELLGHAPALRCVSLYAAGHNNVDLAEARVRGIAVVNTPDDLTASTADLTLLLILAVTRRMREGMAMMTEGRFRGWAPKLLLGRELSALTVGVFGAGRIGSAVIRKLAPFGPRILYATRSGPRPELAGAAEHADFERLLAECDLLTLHAPLTPETRHLFTLDVFRRAKRRPFFVNTARGPLVREADLVEALERNLVSGAALDVYEFEPEAHPKLAEMENVILLPHVGSATVEARQAMSLTAARNLEQVLAGEECPNRVV